LLLVVCVFLCFRYAKGLLTELKYGDTVLPRIPVPIMRKIEVEIVKFERLDALAEWNAANMRAFIQGVKVRTLFFSLKYL
tara:strand:+ start:1305 stop:1544 length:240 start_codon:yes stop_codon:yes gene_type:complete